MYGGKLDAAGNTRLPTFCGVPQYVVTTKWYSLPMLQAPILQRFDFWAKIDVDVCLREPLKLTHELVRKAWFMHTGLVQDNEVCERGLGDFMANFTAQHACSATSTALSGSRPAAEGSIC